MDALLRLGLEKNYDDKLQELLWLASVQADEFKLNPQVLVDGSPLRIDPGASNEINRDAVQFLQSLKSLSKLALTSSAFRMFLSDIVATTRETISEAASQIGDVAAQVQAVAIDIATTAELGDVSATRERAADSYADVRGSVGHAHRNIGTLGEDSAERARDIVVGRIQELIAQARQNPQHKAAIQTIIVLSRKYSQKLAAIVQSSGQTVDIETDMSTPLYNAILDFKIILERLASNHSLDPLLHALALSITDVLDAPDNARSEIRQYFSNVESWFNRALDEPHFSTSALGTRIAEELYDAGRVLLASEANTQWAKDIRKLVVEAQSFMHALESDTTTQRFIHSLHGVSTALSALVSSARARRDTLLRDGLTWFLPRILRSIHALPMPRIEFQNNTLDLALDFLLLTGASSSTTLSPDHIRVENWNEVVVDMTEGASAQTSSRTRLHIDGIRCRMHGLGWYIKYKGLIPYADEGLLDIDVGQPGVAGQGLAVDLELETSQEERDNPGEPLFRLVDASVSVPGLSFVIRQSKHWILNALLVQPLATPVVRFLLQRTFKQEAEKAVVWADRLLSAVLEEAERINARRPTREAHPTIEDYWTAMLITAPAFFESRESVAVTTQTHVEPTMQGVIHTTTAVPDNGQGTPEESLLAVGIGAQLFPDHGLPSDAAQVAQEAAKEIQNAVQAGADTAKDEAVRLRAGIERSEAHKADRELFERYRAGWKSTAFDLD
ncbi:hypothetical protein C8F01DRAFT_1063710 [Mycena amicta]|nr:hypothetical protein C8F01DRAFT_1063710 [Mycena amicta]